MAISELVLEELARRVDEAPATSAASLGVVSCRRADAPYLSEPMPSADLTGTTLAGRYELQSQLGSGGMAVVYRALDVKVQRQVANVPVTARG